MRYKAKLSYDGTKYLGWQKQPKKRTIQGELEKAFFKISGNKKICIESSGRTDAGVHARAQIVHFDLFKNVDIKKFQQGVNALLDSDIRIHNITKTKKDFHSRYDILCKEYRYFIYNGSVVPPFLTLYRHHEKRVLNLEAMRQAANYLIGKHDFLTFSVNPGYALKDTVRIIHDLKIIYKGSDLIISVKGNGFLYKMVRSISGFLIDVGLNRFSPLMAKKILNDSKRTKVVKTASAKGLFLWSVRY